MSNTIGQSKSSKISRRGFLCSTAVGAAAVAGTGLVGQALASVEPAPAENFLGDAVPSFMVAPEPISDDQITQTIETELLVIGGGIGGSVTGCSAAENGLKVTMIDKLVKSRSVGRDFGFPNGQPVLDAGFPEEDPYEMTRDYVEKSAHRVSGDFVHRFFTRAHDASVWWNDKCASWDLFPEVQAYCSTSDCYKNYTHITNWYPTEGRLEKLPSVGEGDRYYVMTSMLAHMVEEIEAAGGQYLTETEAVQLIQEDDGSISGAICTTADGSYIKIVSSVATVLATGDYAANEEMFRYYSEWPLELFEYRMSTGQGEGHKLGMWVGGQMQNRPLPNMLFHGYCYHYLRVNARGNRYVNEDSGYQGTAVAQLRQPGGKSWAIWDGKWAEEIPASLEFGGGMAWDQDFRKAGEEWTAEREEETAFSWERDAGLLVQADTLDDLADQIGFEGTDKDNFLASVARYNELVEAGFDDDFGKRPELLTSITEPPFFGLRMRTELAVSAGGLITNIEGNVVDGEGKEIPGLYAIGTVTGTLIAVDYNETTSPGISLGRNVTFGWLMGKHFADMKA